MVTLMMLQTCVYTHNHMYANTLHTRTSLYYVILAHSNNVILCVMSTFLCVAMKSYSWSPVMKKVNRNRGRRRRRLSRLLKDRGQLQYRVGEDGHGSGKELKMNH